MITAIFVQLPVAVYGFWYLFSNGLVRGIYWLYALLFLFVPLLGAQFIIVKSNGMKYGKFWSDAIKSMATRRAQAEEKEFIADSLALLDYSDRLRYHNDHKIIKGEFMMEMTIRHAKDTDILGIAKLLEQVLMVHHNGRPDLFKANTRKYTDEELKEIIADPEKPIFVAVDENDTVMGYAFCVYQQYIDDNILTDIKTLYIDDICVDESLRGNHIGSALYNYVIDYAKNEGFYNVTLNVWSCNPGAMKFYEECGLVPYKVGMEKILD